MNTTTSRATAAAAALALTGLLAACGTTPSPAGPAASHKAPAATHSATPSAPSAAETAKANTRQFAYWLASSPTDHAEVDKIITGPVMHGYVTFQANFDAANAAAGEPITPASVVAIPGGYQLVGDDGTVQAFTAFQHDAAGRITDLHVGGQPIAPRLAVGPDNTGHLKITDVVAYRPAVMNEVVIVFKVKNVGGPLNNGDFLIKFSPTDVGQLEADWQNSPTVPTLHPGESTVIYAVFGTRMPTGTLTLRSNDSYETVYASTTLSRP